MRIFRYAKVVILAPAVGSAAIGIAGLAAVGAVLIAGRGRVENHAAGRQSGASGIASRGLAGEPVEANAAVSKTGADAGRQTATGAATTGATSGKLVRTLPQTRSPEKRNANAPGKQAEARLNFSKLIDGGQLAFLNDYAGRTANDADGKQKVKALVEIATPYTPYHFGADFPLPQVLDSLVIGDPQPVAIRDGRYATISGIRIAAHNRAGLLWVDMQEGIALGAIYFDPTNGEPSPTLTIFSRQLDQRTVRMSELPQAFREDLSRWAATENVPPVLTRYFIGASGDKYVLKHDENFCARPSGVAAPLPEGSCEEMNAQAALIDLQAAKFVEQTHNASNATIRTIALK